MNPHIDNSHDANRKKYRRLNLLYYVTPETQESDGGNFELWDKKVINPLKIPSKFNRLVVMETTKHSWHSVDHICSNIERCCVSNYFFSNNSPKNYEYYHVTSFLGRPDERLKRVYGVLDNFLRNKYPQFKGLNYSTPITSVSSQGNEVYLPPPPDNPSFIAVVDFTGNNVSEGDCRALTDRLRAELFNTKHYKVIEREMMEEINKEQGFQQSGCSTDECIVEVGKLIGVEKIVGGSISKVGRTYSVSSRIVSVETGKILKGATYDYKGEIDELLTTGMRKVAYELIK